MGSWNNKPDGRSAGELIARFVDAIGARDEKGVVPFVQAWPQIVGPDLAAHSRVLDVRNKAVVVGLDHPGWLQKMHMNQDRIVAAVQRRFPTLEIRYLQLTVVEGLQDVPRGPGLRPPGDVADDRDRDAGGEDAEASSTGDTGAQRTGASNAAETDTPPDDSVTSAAPPPSAAEDRELMEHLKGLEAALRRKNSEN